MTSRRKKKRANLRDVARAAEVSVATVSRVLNSPDIVQTETRRRVEAAIAELQFVRSAAARAINTGRSKIVGALIPTLDSDIFAQTIDAMESRLADFGFSLVVATTDDNREIEARKAHELLDIGVEGLFLSGVTHNEELHALVERSQVPAVAISYFDPDYYLPTIGYDNRAAGRAAMEHLTALGHRNIAVIHGPAQDNDRTRERLGGVADQAKDLNLISFETELSVLGGSHAATELLEKHVSLDAFLCITDVLAFGVLFELQRRGVAVPEDTSVMGLQDLPGAAVTCPRLTTIRLPSQEMGTQAAEALANWIEDEVRPAPICCAFELKARESTGKRHGN